MNTPPITIDDCLKIQTVSGLQHHPVLPMAVYTLTVPDPETDTNKRILGLIDITNGEVCLPALPLVSSATSGFFFWGIRLEPVE